MTKPPGVETTAADICGLVEGHPSAGQVPMREKDGFTKQYWEQRLSERRGLDGVGHISFGLPFNKCLYDVRRRVFTRNLRTVGIELGDASVLDVGSGTGFWLDVWNSLGVRSMASVDLTHVSVERLRRDYPRIRVEQADISSSEAIKLFADRFDIISAFDVLFHILDDEGYRQALANVSHLLVPGGYFIFSDFFLHGEERRTSHEVDRPLEKIQADLTACGLKTLLRVPMFVLMNSPVDTHRKWLLPAWHFLMAPMHFVPALGWLYGAALSPIDLILMRMLHEGPTTEMMICQKI